jgi:hypothetical protein
MGFYDFPFENFVYSNTKLWKRYHVIVIRSVQISNIGLIFPYGFCIQFGELY